jgi:hypothetical protein
MNITRTVILGVTGGALAAWLAADVTGTRQIVVPPATRTSGVDARGADLAAEIARLHERLHPTAAPQQPARNLFEFRLNGARTPAPAGGGIGIGIDVAPAPAIEPAAAPEPAFALIGVAEDAGVRTAIISGQGQLFMVKDGDLVAERYRVMHVGADAVDLDPSLHLTLK